MAKPKIDRHAPQEVNAYLAGLPTAERQALQDLREWIHELIPNLTERIGYGIPIFRREKDLVGMAMQKKHCSLYVMSPTLVKRLKPDLKEFNISGGTIHFQPETPIPRSLIERILRERLLEIDE